MHIPVIIAGIILGWKKGAFAGFVFGLTSFLKASFIAPNITSFLFSPLYPGGNFWSLVICFVPRILVGVIAYFVFTGLMKVIKNRKCINCYFGFSYYYYSHYFSYGNGLYILCKGIC